MIKLKKLLSGIILASLVFSLPAQIHLQNASFEEDPEDATIPVSWHGCNIGTTPDILPGIWGVYKEASEGDTYVGLITRDDGSTESIGQRLSSFLEKDQCYSFSLDLAHSTTYSGFNKPIKLRIWAGNTKCDKSQLILETDLIKHTTWKTYGLNFFAKQQTRYLIFEAFYSDEPFSLQGNILIDNITVVKKCPRA
jgi:hypothetical protein